MATTFKKKYEGKVYQTKNNGALKILDYKGRYEVHVIFLDTGYTRTTSMTEIKNGFVKDLLKPSVYGVGYLGEEYTNIRTDIAYKCWRSMLMRCYCSKSRSYSKNNCYKGCTVHKDWHNFTTFKKWHVEHYPKDGNTYQLDKDKMVPNNKEYNSATCSFLTTKQHGELTNAKTYYMQDPQGKQHRIYNMAKFCTGTNLIQGSMTSVCLGKRTHHKGWINSTDKKFNQQEKNT